MQTFCPYCLQSIELQSRAPGQYAFDCPECGLEAVVTVPEHPTERVVAFPIKSQRSSEPSSAKPRRPVESARRAPPAQASEDAPDRLRESPVRKPPRIVDGSEDAGAGRRSVSRPNSSAKKRLDPFQDEAEEQDRP